MSNLYLPIKAQVIDIIQETSSDIDIKTYKLKLIEKGKTMRFKPGQFFGFSMPGFGEAPFGFASSPFEDSYFEVSIKKVGLVTEEIHNLKKGDTVWVRGPLGNTFPTDLMEEHNLLVIAGGLGLAPLRPLIAYVLHKENRDKFGKIQMLIAARNPGDFIYKRNFNEWGKVENTEVLLTIDRLEEGWEGKVGFPHNIVEEMDIDFDKTFAVTCGPPIMIKFVSTKLMELGIPKNKIYTTLEMRMTCGVGKCGKCNIGHKYVCIDGPVFCMEELVDMPQEY